MKPMKRIKQEEELIWQWYVARENLGRLGVLAFHRPPLKFNCYEKGRVARLHILTPHFARKCIIWFVLLVSPKEGHVQRNENLKLATGALKQRKKMPFALGYYTKK